MNNNVSKLLFLAIGAAVGAAVGYVAASDKKDEWIKDIHGLVDRIKCNTRQAANKGEELIDEIVSDLDGE